MLSGDSFQRDNSGNRDSPVEKRSAMITAVSSSKRREYENPGLKSVRRRFRFIPVATDFTPASKTAVKLAAHFAKENHAKLVVLHSIMPDIYVLDMGPVPTLDKIDLKNARANLRKYSEHIPELRTENIKTWSFWGRLVMRSNLSARRTTLICSCWVHMDGTAGKAGTRICRRMGHLQS